jgi:hypothetical protein
MITHEAGVLGVSGFSQVAKWSIAVVSGLGAFDCVSGATVIQQVAPVAGSSTVPATNGSLLNFIVQVTGAPSRPKSWKLTGALPAGLTHQNKIDSYTDSVTGFPTQNGSFPVTITAYEKEGYTGGAVAEAFTITVTGGVSPPAITIQPAVSTTVNAGSTAVLSVGASGTSPAYQWYAGAAGNTANPIAGAVASTYTTPALLTTSSYWVRVTNPAGAVDSNTATISVSVVDTFSSWAATRFSPSEAADPAISGPTMDPDGDGITNEQEFVFGGAPLAGDRPVTQSMDPVAGEFSLSFQASTASGPGYAGLTRHYAVESSRTLGGSVAWSAVPGFNNIIGNGQTVNFTAPVPPGSSFYQVKVWLASE